MSQPQDSQEASPEELKAAGEAQKAAELAHSHISRFLELQAGRNANLIMKAHEAQLADAAKAAEVASQLTTVNIRRFLDLQAARAACLIMSAHQKDVALPVEKTVKGG